MTPADPLKPSVGLLVKLGSIAVHTAEMLSAGGHPFDKHALETLLNDHEVIEWTVAMTKQAFLPVRRDAPPTKPAKARK